MTNVVSITRSRKKSITRSRKKKSTTYAVSEQVMYDLRMKMHEWYPKDLAEEMNVSVACVYAIRSGRTKWPRGKTFFALVDALGLQFVLVEK